MKQENMDSPRHENESPVQPPLVTIAVTVKTEPGLVNTSKRSAESSNVPARKRVSTTPLRTMKTEPEVVQTFPTPEVREKCLQELRDAAKRATDALAKALATPVVAPVRPSPTPVAQVDAADGNSDVEIVWETEGFRCYPDWTARKEQKEAERKQAEKLEAEMVEELRVEDAALELVEAEIAKAEKELKELKAEQEEREKAKAKEREAAVGRKVLANSDPLVAQLVKQFGHTEIFGRYRDLIVVQLEDCRALSNRANYIVVTTDKIAGECGRYFRKLNVEAKEKFLVAASCSVGSKRKIPEAFVGEVNYVTNYVRVRHPNEKLHDKIRQVAEWDWHNWVTCAYDDLAKKLSAQRNWNVFTWDGRIFSPNGSVSGRRRTILDVERSSSDEDNDVDDSDAESVASGHDFDFQLQPLLEEAAHGTLDELNKEFVERKNKRVLRAQKLDETRKIIEECKVAVPFKEEMAEKQNEKLKQNAEKP